MMWTWNGDVRGYVFMISCPSHVNNLSTSGMAMQDVLVSMAIQ